MVKTCFVKELSNLHSNVGWILTVILFSGVGVATAIVVVLQVFLRGWFFALGEVFLKEPFCGRGRCAVAVVVVIVRNNGNRVRGFLCARSSSIIRVIIGVQQANCIERRATKSSLVHVGVLICNDCEWLSRNQAGSDSTVRYR